jgi:hypothetical protein
VAWVLALARAGGGDSALALRTIPILGWIAAVAALTSHARDRALWWAWALGLPPLFFLTNLAIPDGLLLAAWGGALAGALAGGRGWWVAGALAGLASLAKYTGVLLLPLLILAAPGPERRSAHPWAGLAVALALLAPNLAWNAAHGWVTARFVVSEGLLSAPGWTGPLVQVLDQALVVGPVAFGAAVAASVRGGTREDRLLVAASAPVLALFALAALGGRPEAHWPAPAWIGAGLLVSRATGRIRRAGELGAWLGVFATAAIVAHAERPWATFPGDPGVRLTEGRILAEEVDRWSAATATDPARPVLTERYQEAALIEWHTGSPARVLPGCGRPSQYDLEPAPLPAEGLFVRPLRGGPPSCALARCDEVSASSPIRRLDRWERRVGPWDVFELGSCR